MTTKPIVQKIVLAGIVFRGERVLILQRSEDEKVYPGMWGLPSGKREPLESSEQSLLREISEKTGLAVKIIAPISVFDYQIEEEKEIRDATQINCLVTPLGNTKKHLLK